MQKEEKFSLYHYFNHHDFRIILGLTYLVELTKEMGAFSKIEPVPSFALGTNVISVAEVAKIYQTFTDGKIYRFYKEGPTNQLNFIKRIEDREGNVLFEPKKQEFRIVDHCFASQMVEILQKVVTHGTGRRARGELYVSLDENEQQSKEKPRRIRIPAFGKTGTTNDYTTAYFAGFLPYPTKHRAPLDPSSSYTIASYVGYDFNQMMKRGPFRTSGAHGALPIWTDFSRAVINSKKYIDYIDKLDLSLLARQVWPLKQHTCTRKIKADLPRGTIISAANPNDVEVFNYTNIEQEGESFYNEFGRDTSVTSSLLLATSLSEGIRNPLRSFYPFIDSQVLEEDLETKGEISPENQPSYDSDQVTETKSQAARGTKSRIRKAMNDQSSRGEPKTSSTQPKTPMESQKQTEENRDNDTPNRQEDDSDNLIEEELW